MEGFSKKTILKKSEQCYQKNKEINFFFFLIQNISLKKSRTITKCVDTRQDTLGSQLKIGRRIYHKNQHLLIFYDFGKNKKK